MLACGGHRNIPPAVAVFFVVDKGEALRTHCVGPPLLSGGVAWKEGITRPALVELQAYLAHHTHHCFHLLTAGQSLLLDVAECFGPQSRRTFVHKAHSTFGFSGWVLHHCRPSFSFLASSLFFVSPNTLRVLLSAIMPQTSSLVSAVAVDGSKALSLCRVPSPIVSDQKKSGNQTSRWSPRHYKKTMIRHKIACVANCR